jgi:phospholipid/cholesterol/gamma-HCH transport system substrate-binding protein
LKRNILETIVGAFVLFGALGFLYFAYTTANLKTPTGYTLKAKFTQINGLKKGSDVRIGGIKIGSITDVSLDPKAYQAVVHFVVDHNVKIPVDSIAAISQESLLGGNYLGLIPGVEEEMLKQDGEIEKTNSALDLAGMLGKAIFSSTKSSTDKQDSKNQ